MADLPDAATCYELLARMALIRRFEEEAGRQYQRAKAGGFLHLAIGEEATIVGTTSVMRHEDFLIGTYRTHGHAIARGTEPEAGDGGAVRPRRRDQRRPRRLDAHLRRRAALHGRLRDRRRQPADRRRPRPRLPVQGRRRGHRLHVRRRRLQHRQLRRDDEPGGAVEAAGPLPGREQPLRDGDRGRAPLGPDRPLEEGRGLRDPRASGSTGWTWSRCARGSPRGSGWRARSSGRPCWRPSPTATAATPPPTPRSTASARRSRSGARKTRSRASRGAASRPGCWASARCSRRARRPSEAVLAAVEFAEASPEPALDTMYENLYALDRAGRLVRGRRAQPGAAPRRATRRRCPRRRASWPRPAPPTPGSPKGRGRTRRRTATRRRASSRASRPRARIGDETEDAGADGSGAEDEG